MKITGIPALSDNYIWVIKNEILFPNQAWIVDCGEAQPVIDFFKTHKLQLKGILLTHHHYDHIDGIEEVLKTLGNVPIVSNARGPFKAVTQPVEEGDEIDVLGETFKVISIPGHTQEHLAFYNNLALFSGDVLFTAGCGKSWTQAPKVMAASLMKINNLPDSCTVYCGHDYTFANINFANIVEPNNPDIELRRKLVHEQNKMGLASVPESLKIEKTTNPFLRFNLSPLKEILLDRQQQFYDYAPDSDANLFATLRAWKDELDQTDILDKS